MYNETVRRLEDFTDSSEFERLGCTILVGLGYKGIEPQGTGKKDGGKDALHLADDDKTVIHFSLQKDWNKKLKEDLERTQQSNGDYTKFVFVTNSNVPPLQRDKLKISVKSQYGWELEIFDKERLRAELDGHRLDLREQYLAIPKDTKLAIDETVDDFIDKHKKHNRLLLLAVPNSEIANRMGLFDTKRKFVGDVNRLKETLGKLLPSVDFNFKITSNGFSTFYVHKEEPGPFGFSFRLFGSSDDIYESNLYNTGIIEAFYSLDIAFKSSDINEIIENFFATVIELYNGFLGKNDYVTIVICFIGANSMILEKNDGIWYNGEEYYLYHGGEAEFQTLYNQQNFFIETINNKIENFFNVKSGFRS